MIALNFSGTILFNLAFSAMESDDDTDEKTPTFRSTDSLAAIQLISVAFVAMCAICWGKEDPKLLVFAVACLLTMLFFFLRSQQASREREFMHREKMEELKLRKQELKDRNLKESQERELKHREEMQAREFMRREKMEKLKLREQELKDRNRKESQERELKHREEMQSREFLHQRQMQEQQCLHQQRMLEQQCLHQQRMVEQQCLHQQRMLEGAIDFVCTLGLSPAFRAVRAISEGIKIKR